MRTRLVVAATLLAAAATSRADQPFFVRDANPVRHAIEEAKAALQAGETMRGLRELQRVLDEHGDDIVRVAEDPRQTRWVSARDAARTVLFGLPAEQRAAYEEWAGPTAETLLARAVEARDEAAMRSVALRYGACSTGVDAARLLAESALEAGRPVDAAAAAALGLKLSPKDPWLWA